MYLVVKTLIITKKDFDVSFKSLRDNPDATVFLIPICVITLMTPGRHISDAIKGLCLLLL